MKADLEDLIISDEDIYTFSGMHTTQFIAFLSPNQLIIDIVESRVRNDQKFAKKWSSWTEVEKQKYLRSSVYVFAISSYLLYCFFISIPMYIVRAIIVIVRNRSLKKIIRLIKEVQNHNQIVKNLHTLDQLVEAGNPIKLNDRGTVIDALRITRAGLVRTLKTEKILRENPKFMPEYFNIDLTTIESEKTTVRAVEYAELLNDALQVGVSVQQAMRKLKDSY